LPSSADQQFESRPVWDPGDAGAEARSDRVVVEAPLELRVGGAPVVTVMRTPGHDRELALGMALAEGWCERSQPARYSLPDSESLHPEEVGNVAILELDRAIEPRPRFTATSACGVCGKQAIADLELRIRPVSSGLEVSPEVVAGLPDALRAEQSVFEHTGGAHAAGLFSGDGELLCVREDVGRHNAVDKVVGWSVLAGRELADTILFVSGRVGFEIAQKAAVAGIPLVAAVSAPSSLAIDVAERFRVTLCGFVRGHDFNVYAHSIRIAHR
jgi:FdhD protein